VGLLNFGWIEEPPIDEFADSNTIKIQALSSSASLESICSYFAVFGSILSIKRLSESVVILAFENKASATNAIKYVDGKVWNEQRLYLSRAKPIEPLDDVVYGSSFTNFC
jgi:hypothetical protein